MADVAKPGMRALCFVDMPFGKKADLASGTEIDFDQIYQAGIKPAIEAAGLEALRGDEERTGGIIHSAMFARLLLAEFVVADLTLANPNVFYELGIRHAAKPYHHRAHLRQCACPAVRRRSGARHPVRAGGGSAE